MKTAVNQRMAVNWFGWDTSLAQAIRFKNCSWLINIQEEADVTNEHIKLFLNGVNKSKSIKILTLLSFGRRNFLVNDIKALVKDSTSLVTLILCRCVLDHQAISLLSVARTLQMVHFDRMHMNGDRLSDTLAALGMLPHLHTLALTNVNIGVNECSDIAAFWDIIQLT